MSGSCFEDANLLDVCRQSIDYQGIVRHISDGVLILREGNIVFTNAAFCEIAGRENERLLGRPFSNVVAPGDRERVVRHCKEKLFSPDLTDRIEFTIPKAGDDAIVEMKLTVVDCGGAPAILAINPAAEALYGVPRRAFTSGEARVMHFVHPEDRAEVLKYYRELAEEEFGEMQYRIISSNGRIKWVHDEAHLVYCTGRSVQRIDHVIRDITEQKEALDALKRSEEKYRDFFQGTKDMVYSVTPEGRFLDINEAGIRMLGFESREEVLASNLKDIYENLSERADLLAQINEDGFVEDKHVRFRLRDGRSIEVAITARAKMDDNGYLLYYESIAHNITQALEDQRNRVLRNAAGGMCHYLNTHLMHIQGAKDGIREEVEALDERIDGILPPEAAAEWRNAESNLRAYCEGLDAAFRKVSAVTRAFNSAFLTYKEEAYLDKAILDIFNACREGEQEISTAGRKTGDGRS